jgi:predicted transcriptional regulator
MTAFSDYIEEILSYLKNKESVDINEVKYQLILPDEITTSILEFMEFSRFIKFDNKKKNVQIFKCGELLLNLPQ